MTMHQIVYRWKTWEVAHLGGSPFILARAIDPRWSPSRGGFGYPARRRLR